MENNIWNDTRPRKTLTNTHNQKLAEIEQKKIHFEKSIRAKNLQTEKPQRTQRECHTQHFFYKHLRMKINLDATK